MAIIDTEKNHVVIRIVFDGVSLSGKTTVVHALRDALKPNSDVYSPGGGNATSTTAYFDWIEYTGGQFKQIPITCQIVSTPSQPEFYARREYLLNTADVVIFVIDASNTDQQAALEYYASVQTIQAEKAFKICLIANKQDQKVTINDKLVDLYRAADGSELKIIQTSALKNRGIRETFVFAVRLASERLETLIAQGVDLKKQTIEKTADELFNTIQQLDHETTNDIDLSANDLEALADSSEESVFDSEEKPTASNSNLTDTQFEILADLSDDDVLPEHDNTGASAKSEAEFLAQSEESESNESTSNLDDNAHLIDVAGVTDTDENLENIEMVADTAAVNESSKSQRLPRFPDEETPYRWIYPPLLGRHILAKPDFRSGLRPSLNDETWMIDLDGRWRCFSNQQWEYPTEEAARQALREQMAWHVKCNPLLMKQRCVAIAQERKTWRLWQITQTPTDLAEQLTQALLLTDISQLVVEIFTCATCYLDAYQELLQLPFEFKVQLDNVEVHEKNIAYLGAIYGEKSSTVDDFLGSNEAIKQVLKQGFAPILQQAVRTEDLDVEAIIMELETVQTQDDNLVVVEALTELFIEAI